MLIFCRIRRVNSRDKLCQGRGGSGWGRGRDPQIKHQVCSGHFKVTENLENGQRVTSGTLQRDRNHAVRGDSLFILQNNLEKRWIVTHLAQPGEEFYHILQLNEYKGQDDLLSVLQVILWFFKKMMKR